MRNYLIVMLATMCLGISLVTTVRAQDVDWRTLQQKLKLQQKVERNALKTQQRNIKQSWKTMSIPSASRAQMKHQMQRERRDLKQKQKDALQNLKDEQRASKQNQRIYGQ